MSWDRGSVDDLQRRLQAILARGTVKSVEDALLMQYLDIEMQDGHVPTRVEQWHHYGMTFNPHPGSEVLVASLGGNPDHMIVVANADRRYRMKSLAAGELAIHDDQGQYVHFKRGGIHINSGHGITIEGPITVKGDINQQGSLTSTGSHTASSHV